MYQQYDNAVQIVFDYFFENGFSKTVHKDFRRATKKFREYLEGMGLEYSRQNAKIWLNFLKPKIPRIKFLILRRALYLVDHAMQNGIVTTVRFEYDDTPNKYQVPDCYRHLLESYLNRRRSDGIQASTLQMDAIACTQFLLYLSSKSIIDIGFITPEIVKAYHIEAKHRTIEGKNAYMYRIKGFVRFLAAKDLVADTLELAFPTEKASKTSIVTVLSKEQTDTIRRFCQGSTTPSELRRAAMVMLALRMGLRSVDICNLYLSNISWKSRTLSLTQQKTGVPLTLPLPVEVSNLLIKYILEGRPVCEVKNVFVTLKHPYTGLDPSSCYYATVKILGQKRSAIDVRGLHIARRTFASDLLVVGNTTSLISATLGHASDSAVDKYLATDGPKLRKCAIGLAGIELAGGLK